MKFSRRQLNNVEIITGENDHLRFGIAPRLGGKIMSIYNKEMQKEFLWINKGLPLAACDPGSDYDSHFLGGIDELIPNDIPEEIDSVSYPDHGELWTLPLQYEIHGEKVSVFEKLKLSRLFYRKTVHLDPLSPVMHVTYKIRNEAESKQYFLWKLHAALVIDKGDRLITSARTARVVYPESSRFGPDPFKWPVLEDCDVSIVPSSNGTLDFFYLYDIQQGEMQIAGGNENSLFRYSYDKKVFPYQWYFASYGGFSKHYTAILEPSTGMPVSVNEARGTGQCMALEPGEEINTTVQIYAGKNNHKNI